LVVTRTGSATYRKQWTFCSDDVAAENKLTSDRKTPRVADNTMTFPCQIGWNWPEAPYGEPGSVARVRTAEELRQRLSDIRVGAQARQIAIAVNVVTPKNHMFSLVLGLGDGSILTYDGRGGDPPYLVSVGNTSKDRVLVSYFYGGQRSELPASHVILEELAVDALVDSIENEHPSSLIRWHGG